MRARDKKHNRRRYYLHVKVREFTSVDARAHQVEVNDRILGAVNATQRMYLKELASYGYNLQTFIE